jgi:sarcosine oxidase gamma subunit
LDASLFAEDEEEEEEAAGPYFGGIQVRIQRFGIRVQGSEKTRTLLRLFTCLDLDASFFAEEEAEAGPFFGGIEVQIQRFGFRV